MRKFITLLIVGLSLNFASAQTSTITLCVDLSCYPTVTAPSVFGQFNGWCANCNLLTEMGTSGVYCTDVQMADGNQEYKFFFQEEGAEDMDPVEDANCTLTTAGFTNRVVTVAGVAQSLTFGWEDCGMTCVLPPTGTDITFCVDISCFPSVTAPTIFGAFNGWNAGANPIIDNGSGVYCTTIGMMPGDQEFKFFFQEEGAEDMDPVEDANCTLTTSGFTNRIITVVDGVTATYSYGWEDCGTTCTAGPTTTDITLCVDMSCLSSITAPTVFGGFNGWNAGANPIVDNGSGVYCATVGMLPGAQEFKFFRQEGEEVLESPEDDACTITSGPFTNRLITVVDGVTATYNYGWQNCGLACEACELVAPSTTPDCGAIDVLSVYSDLYGNYPGANYLGAGSGGTLNQIDLGGNNVNEYEITDTVFIETASNPIDATGMQTLNVDFFACGMDIVCFHLVDFGADGVAGGDDDASMEFCCNNIAQNQWVSFDIPVSGFVGLPATTIGSIGISGIDGMPGYIVVDNMYFDNGNCMPGTSPLAPAPDPTCPAADVISLFSNTYTDVPVSTFLTPWSQATLTNVALSGNDMLYYQNVNFLGIETVGPNLIDASAMTTFHLDFWTADMTEFRVKLVDFGADGNFGGGDDTEHELAFPSPAQMSWVNLEIPLSSFVGLTNTSNIAQIILSGNPSGGGNVFVDNIYFSTCSSVPTAPLTAAPTPTCPAADVTSLYSNAYTDVTVDTWLTVWSQATLTDIQVAGDDTKLYENVNFLGIETVGPNSLDVSMMNAFHIDIWTPNMTTFRVKLVDFGADNAFGGGDDSEHEITIANPAQATWVSLELLLSDFTGINSFANISQIILSGVPAGAGTVYVDNVYFSKCGTLPTMPVTAAPDPVCPAANVISMFSNSYTDVTVDTWLTVWSAANLADVQVAGNDTKLYTNVNFLGIETVGPNLIDATNMNTFHLDFWTPNMTEFRVKLVDFGADGLFGGGDDTEHELAFPNPALSTWVSLEIPLSDFTGLGSTANIAQLILSGNPSGAGTVYVDNVYYSSCGPLTTAAATPTCPANDVISMYSNAYSDVPVDTWLTVWSAANLADIQIAGNDTKLYTNVNFLGIETVGPNLIDATAMTNINLDIYTPNMTTFKVKLVDFGADGLFGGGDDTEHELSFTPAMNNWVTLKIPLSDFTGLASTANLAQLIFSGDPAGAGTFYLDNVYYSTCP